MAFFVVKMVLIYRQFSMPIVVVLGRVAIGFSVSAYATQCPTNTVQLYVLLSSNFVCKLVSLIYFLGLKPHRQAIGRVSNVALCHEVLNFFFLLINFRWGELKRPRIRG